MSNKLLSAQPPEWEWVGPLLAKMVGAIAIGVPYLHITSYYPLVLKNPLKCFFSNNSFGVPEPPKIITSSNKKMVCIRPPAHGTWTEKGPQQVGVKHYGDLPHIQPRELTWIPKMMVWKTTKEVGTGCRGRDQQAMRWFGKGGAPLNYGHFWYLC